jgi:filamentous hemagglutinin family protein
MTQQQLMSPSIALLQPRSAALRRAVRAALHVVTPAALLVMSGAPVMAGPQDGAVVRGAASIETPAANVVNVNQTTDRAVINWRSFSIGADEQVNFNQPSSDSATLNRVLGGQRSVIEGALSANGQVYLLNTSGVLFTSSAKVDVGGLVATTSTIRDDDFMAGDLKFTATAHSVGEIANEGTITIRDGGMAALVAPTVRNQGIISARLGRIALGAGETFTLDLYGDQLINFALPGTSSGGLVERGLEQAGSLIADGGQVLLTTDAAAGIVGGVVNMSGIVQARTVEQNARGEIVLVGGAADVDVSGRLDASGRDARDRGGSIDVFGQSVHLSSSAVVNATGASGGGAVRIGGGFADDNTPRATATIVAEGATIDVSATDTGDAGTVAVWGNDSAQFAGTIRARGGEQGGDGGFVEVSSKGLLQFLGGAVTDAPMGRAGTVLLDPQSIRIEAIGSNSPTASVIAASALNSMLRQGTSVILLADDSITVNATIDGRPTDGSGLVSGSVDLTAGNIIVLRPIITNNAAISVTASSGSITFGSEAFLYVANTSGATGVGAAPISITAATGIDARQLVSLGAVTVRALAGDVHLREALYGLAGSSGPSGIGALHVTAESGSVVMNGASSSGAIVLTGATAVSNATRTVAARGGVEITAGTGGVRLEQTAAGAAGIDSGAAVTIATGGAVTLNSGIRTSGGNIVLGGPVANSRIASLTMGQGTSLQTAVANGPQDGGISIFANGPVDVQGLVAGQSGAISVDAIGPAGDVTLRQPLYGLANATTQIGSLTITASGDVQTSGARAAQEVTISGAGITNSSNSIIAGGDVSLTSTGTGGITLSRVEDPTDSDDRPEAAIDSVGSVSLDTVAAAQITLNSGVRANGSNIRIGAGNAPVGSVTMGSGTAMQTAGFGTNEADQDGSISINSAGAVIAETLAAGEAGAVTIVADGSVTVNQSIAGLVSSGGVGAVSITSGGSIEVHGAKVAGAIELTADGGIVNQLATLAGGSIDLTADADLSDPAQEDVVELSAGGPSNAALDGQGDVEIRSAAEVRLGGSVRSVNGDIRIGSSAAPARVGSVSMAPGTIAEARNGSVAIHTSGTVSADSIVAGSGTDGVTIRAGRIALLRPIDGPGGGTGFVDLEAGAIAEDVYDIDFSGARVDGAGGVRAVVRNGGSIALRGPILSAGTVRLGRATPGQAGDESNARLNLSHNIFTTGADVLINADVTLFEGIDRWMLESQLENDTADPLDSLFQAADISLALPDSDPPLSSSGVCDVPNECSADHTPLCSTGSFACTVKSFDENGDEISYLDVPAFLAMRFVRSTYFAAEVNADGELIGTRNQGDGGCSFWACGYRQNNDIGTELARVSRREQVLTHLLGVLSVSIETAGGDVTIAGNVGRTTTPVTVTDPLPTDPNVDIIMPTFMNIGLRVDSTSGGGSGDIAVSGTIGDDLGEALRTGVQLENDAVSQSPFAIIDRVNFNDVDLGVFSVQMSGNVQPLVNGFGDFQDGQGQPLAAITAPQLNYAGLPYRLDIWTTGDKGTTRQPTDLTPPGQSPDFQFVTSPGSGSDLLGLTNTAGSVGLVVSPDDGITAQSATAGDDPGSTIESESRRQNEDEATDDNSEENREESCPRGAGATADLGESRGVDGSAPDVFSRCEEAG